MDKGASSRRLRSSRPVSSSSDVAIEIAMHRVSLRESAEDDCSRDTNCRAATSPSVTSTTHSLIPNLPMQSSLRGKSRSSQENFTISSELTDSGFSFTARRVKVILMRLKPFLLLAESATCLRKSS